MAAAPETKTVHSPALTYFSMLSLLSLCPPFVILLWYTMVNADGSVAQTWNYLKQHGLQAFEAALQLLLPGKRVEGPISPTGNRPVYKANGMAAYFVTLVTYISLWWFEIFNPTVVYDHLGEIYSALIFGSLIFCVFLYIKGHVAPSSTDSGSSGNFIIDFYWGMELYPRIGKNFDIKVFTNCRFGMMSWAVLAVTYCIKQYELNGKVSDSMLVNTTLMLVYVTKFFWWEAGYWNTMDIAHDRAGFYICWGCLVWVPSVYTSPGMYLVNHPVNLGMQWGLARHFHYVPEILAAFFWTVPALFNHFLPYFYVVFLTILLFDRAKRDDDRCRSKDKNFAEQMANAKFGERLHQRFVSHASFHLHSHVRKFGHWYSKSPSELVWSFPQIEATYTTTSGETKTSFLLTSGYGKYWKLYCNKVPYKIVPGIY
ncbi:hypothetical protein GOBAR_DD20021 [Gossypium barbadense]|nr:hypothetical protein GOBAR_DD20021 [Gossypium barbadense]